MIHGLDSHYIKSDQRKKIALIGDDIRTTSGVAGVLRDIVIGTSMKYNWVQIAGSLSHPEHGKRLDLSADTNKFAGIEDSSIILYPYNGYGDINFVKQLIEFEKPDALMIMTDPRYFYWLFQGEDEIRRKIPLMYLNIWDDIPYPMYNKPFYESCDALFGISKQTVNINKVVLGDKAKNKVIKYVPHGIDENFFFPIDKSHPSFSEYIKFKNSLLKGKDYEFIVLWNSRNIRRKCTSDVMLAWKIFIDSLPEEQAIKYALILHTQPVDDNGTDLPAVRDMLFGNNKKYNLIISDKRLATPEMNYLYNLSDVVTLISSNEGWGLSLTEAMMCEKPIIANVQGGMIDQMRFENENGDWLEYKETFASNIFGTYKKCGKWAFPVFPSNISLIGSVPTPYIYDCRVQPKDVAKAFKSVLDCGKEYREFIGKEARKWVTSDESMMSARLMCKNMIDGIEETLKTFKPRSQYELIKIITPEHPKHYNKCLPLYESL